LKYHLKTFGSKSNPPLLILHGWGIDGSYFYESAKLLSKNHYVLVPDLPGFGTTPEPVEAWSIEEYVHWVERVLNHLKLKKVSILGHSFGGSIGIKLAALHANRVEKLILTGAAGVEAHVWKRIIKRMGITAIAKTLKWLTFIPFIRHVREVFYSKRDYGKVKGVMKETFLKIIQRNLKTDCQKIKCPTILLWGGRRQAHSPRRWKKDKLAHKGISAGSIQESRA